MSHKLLTLGSQPLPLPACGRSLTLEFFDPSFECGAPIFRISLKRLGKEQQGREFCTQRPRIFVSVFRHSHSFA